MHESARRMERTSPLVVVLISLFSAMIFIGLFLRLMNYELRRDEQLYVTPIRLLRNYHLYTDFFYNHPPGSAWWFYGIQQLTGSDYLLLNGRLGVLAGWLIFASGIGIVSFALTRSGLASWCIVILSLANELFLAQTGMAATNNLLPLPFSFLGLGLFILGVKHGHARPMLIGLAGFCLSVAVVFRISAIAFIFPVATAALFLPRSDDFRRRVVRVIIPLVVGGLIGGLPIIIYLVSDPARFLAHVVGYHLGPHSQYFQMPGPSEEEPVTALSAKLSLASSIWLSSATAVSLAALLTLLLTARPWRAEMGPRRWPLPSAAVTVVIGALVFSVAFSFIPTPSHPQYFAPPLICLPLGFALLFASLEPGSRANAQLTLIAATIVVLAVAGPRLVQHLGSVIRPDRWAVMRVHASGVAMAQRLAAAGVSGKVATLSPIYPLEGGLDVYRELATGPFAYRTADITAPEIARFYSMTSPTRVGALLDADPPAALLLGFYPALEEPMLAYAKKNGYVQAPDFAIADREGTGTLFISPGSAAQPPGP